MNNDVYNKQGTSSLDSAYSKLNEAIKKRNALANNQQYDVDNGVALNTTPLAVNEEQTEEADWFTRTYATGLQAYKNVQRGLLEVGEGIIDFALQLVGIFDTDLAEKMISYDITDTILRATDVDSHIYRAVTGKELQDQSWLYEADEKIQDTIISVEQGVGNAIGMMGIGAITGGGAAAFGTMSASAGGQTVEGVFADPNYSGDYLGAVGYGVTSGLAEGAIEYASMGIGNALNSVASKTGIKALENTAGVFTGNYAGKNLGGKVVSYFVSAVSEGGEEVLSEIADPFIKTIYTKESVGESWQNNFSKEQLDNAFLVGTLSSMLVNGGAVIETTREATKYGVDRYGNINRETIEEAAKIKEEMDSMSQNQGQYSQNQYNEIMTQYTKRLDELYRDIESTKNSKALGRAEQFMQDAQIDRGTLQGEEFSKKVAFNTDTQKRIEQFEELIKKNNNRVGVQEAFNVELEASEKPLKDKNDKPVDAYYDSKKKKIVFSKTISPTKAFNFLASHELKHHLDTRADLKDVNNHILEFLKSTNEYAKRKENLKKLGYNDKEIDDEIVADYIGELFKASRSFEQMFTTKENAEKIASLLSLMRRETSDEYIRARYAEAIAKLRNAETYREPTKAVAYSRSDYDVEIELENPNKDSYIKAKEEFGITTRINLAGWLNVDGTMLDFSEGQGYRVQDHREIQNIYNDNSWTDALIQYLAEGNIRLQSYGFELWRKPTSQQIEILKKIIRNNKGEIVVDIDINKKGDTNSYEYEEGTPVNKIIEDINNYFDNGIEPVIDRASDYRYSRAAIEQGVNVRQIEHLAWAKDANITFDTKGYSLVKAMNKLAKTTYKNKREFKSQVRALVNQWFDDALFDGKKLWEHLGLSKRSGEYKTLKKEFIDYYVDKYTLENIDTEDSRAKAIDTMLKNTIGSMVEQIQRTKNLSARSRKSTLYLQKLKQYFKDMFKLGKEYNVLDDKSQAALQRLQSIRFTGTTKATAEVRNIVVELRESFFKSEYVSPFLADLGVSAGDNVINTYFDEAFKFVKDRQEQFSKLQKKPSLETEKTIGDLYGEKYPQLSDKTEAEVVVELLRLTRKAINYSNNKLGKIDGELVDVKKVVQDEFQLQLSEGRDKLQKTKTLFSKVKKFFYSLIDSQAYFNVLAHNNENSFFAKMFKQLQKARNKTYQINRELMSPLRDFFQTEEGKAVRKKLKDKKNTIKFLGKDIHIGTAISLLMASETDNALSHLVGDGIVFTNRQGERIEIRGRDIMGEFFKTENNELITEGNVKYSDEEKLSAIKNMREYLKKEIGNDYNNLISILERCYSSSGEYYIEASEEINGYHYKLKKKFYPTRSDPYSFNRKIGEFNDVNSFVTNNYTPSFTKAVIQGSSNALFISDVLDTYYNFANQLSTYCGITVELKNLNKFLNTSINEDREKLRTFVDKNIDATFSKTYKNLELAMQGLRTTENSDFKRIVRTLRGWGSKVALGANIKTILTQFTSYFKGFIYLKPSSMLKALGKNNNLYDFNYILKHSAYINNRYLDNNILNAFAEGAISNLDHITDNLMKPIEKADMWTLKPLWRATQIECLNEDGTVDLEKAIPMFEYIVEATQAQYDALGNGSITRIDDELLKSFLMYSSESRKQFSRLFEAAYNFSVSKKGTDQHKQAFNHLARTTTSILASTLSVTLIAALLKSLRGGYDDKEEEEIVKDILLQEFGSNVVGMIPFVKDIYNQLVSGYDVQVSGFSQALDLLDIFDYLPKITDSSATDGEKRSAILQVATRVAHFFGIPVRNILNDLLYLAGIGDIAFDSDMVLKLKNFYYNTNSSTLSTYIKTYSKRGDMTKLSGAIQVKMSNGGLNRTTDKVSNEMARLYNKGVLETFPSQLQSEYTVDGVIHKLNKTQYKQAQDIYSLANEAMELMVVSSQYSGLSDDEKAQAIKKLYGAYYEASKASVINASEGTKLSKVVKYIDSGKFASYLAKIDGLKASTPTNKKSVVQSHINRLGISKNEKYLLAHLAGYSISDEAKKAVSTYLRSKGMAYKDSNEYFK